ncbi:MAG: hypothetical protein CSA62_07925 [Planctomycetota bacterium]|nr:MAG: hypothetical protein CSA62_07925 [Planctomycetota bacterium]
MTSPLPARCFDRGLAIDLIFRGEGPEFGDLFLITGDEHPSFPPKSRLFAKLSDLGFEQIDDFFGIRSDSARGDDVAVWLIPVIDDEEAFHEPGPFDAIRLTFDALRHPEDRAELFITAILRLARSLPVAAFDVARYRSVPEAELEAHVRRDIHDIHAHWHSRDIECGSAAAMRL